MTKIYELNVDRLYSKLNKREMTLSDLNENNPFLDWSKFRSGREGKINEFVKTYNSLIDKINEGNAPKIITKSERSKEVRDRFLKMNEYKFKKGNYEIVNMIGSEENIYKFKEEYFQKNENNLFDAFGFSNMKKKEETKEESIEDKMFRLMLYDVFHKGENKLDSFVKEQTNKLKLEKDFNKNKEENNYEGKIIHMIPKYIFANGVQYEVSEVSDLRLVNIN